MLTSIASKFGREGVADLHAVAVEGPRLTASSVNVTSPRAGTTSWSENFEIDRSAWAAAPPASVAELFVSSTSPPPVTVAVLITVAGTGSATVALTMIGG